ncbi:MAG: hypothetical protein DMG06_18030 [Acidobacteria bacterium]|nr:MAG: hypothetical protein DMG06_18030 [Acidobacteriota bacterium]
MLPALQSSLGGTETLAVDYRLHPHYRVQSPLDEVIGKIEAGLDAFVTEKYAEEIEAILNGWSTALRPSPRDFQAIAKVLAPFIEASRLRPAEEQCLRSEANLRIWRGRFSNHSTLGREALLQEMGSFMGEISGLITAEFKLVSITVRVESPLVLHTRLRYDLVGSGSGYYREQRVGHWDLDWERSPEKELLVRKWQAVEETRSRTPGPAFVEITSQVLSGNSSYAEQMLHGTDYWRTLLDAASGIDVYGNNGLAVADIDNDGFDDLYVCQPAGLPNRLYRNRGDGSFEDITEAAEVGVLDDTSSALFGDVDNDGYQDLIVLRASGPLLFLNQGKGKFRLQPNAFRFAQPPQGNFTAMTLADFDRDGWLDIYFCTYIYYQGQDQYRFPVPYCDAQNGPPNFLFRNNGDKTFSDVTAKTNLNQNNNRYSFACGWCDYNDDGWPDLYVANDFGRNNLYRNNIDGTFSDVAAQAEVEDLGAGMSVCWFDYNNDGKQDLYVSNMWSAAGNRLTTQEAFMEHAPERVRASYRKHAGGNSLFRNEGNGRFQDVSATAGVEMGRWAWSSDVWDFDHDGYPDLYIANGMISGPKTKDLESFFWRQVVSQSPLQASSAPKYEQGWNAVNELIRSDGSWSSQERNVFYANNRDGTFSDVSGAVGLDFAEDARAFALTDFDHDGRLEIFLKNRNAPQLRILRNEMKSLGHSIAFRLQGRKSNRDGIGAVVTVDASNGRQVKFLQAGSGFLSQHTKEVFFGLGHSKDPVRASIRWPSGLVQHFKGLPVGHRVRIEEGSEHFQAEPFLSQSKSSFSSSLDQRDVLPETKLLPSASQTWLIEPLAAPEFALPNLDGQTHKLSGLRGSPLLLNFWATRSPRCREELTVFEQSRDRWANRRPPLQVVAVNVNDPGEAAMVRSFVHENKLTFLILLASEEIAGIYNLLFRYLFDRRRDLGIPTSFLLDEEGAILKVYQGSVNPDQLRADLDRIPRVSLERVKQALPFPGTFYGGKFRRNHFTHGVAFFRRGYLDAALSQFQLAVRDNPDYAEAHYNLGTLYLQKHRLADARESLGRAVQLRPDYPNALNNLGMIALEEAHTDEALGHFQAAIRRNPSYTTALHNLGNLYRDQGRLSEAQQILEQALQADPEDPEANYGLGMVFVRQNKAGRAREFLEKAVQVRPDYPEALNNLGVLYLLTGRSAEASTVLRECVRVAPSFDQPYLNLAKVYLGEGKQEQAKEILRKLLEQNPQHALARKTLAELELTR